MKKLIFGITFGLFAFTGFSQDKIANLEGINYQAVAIDTKTQPLAGEDIVNKPVYLREIAVQFTIDQGPGGSVTYYADEHTVTTDKYGMFSVVIGKGLNLNTGVYDNLMEIPWINGDQWLKVEIALKNDGKFEEVSYTKLMAVPFAYYTDDIADNSITTFKVVDETLKNVDIDTGAVETSEILNETILAEDIGTGSVETSEILNETILAEDIDTGAVETSEILNETILAEDIGTGSVETSEILNETILAEDIGTGSVETSEILNETILAEDIGTGSVETSEILNETILAEDIGTGSVETSEILDETILAEDIGTGSVETSEILDETILAEDIATGSVETSEILDETILAEDIGTGSVETSEILNETILAEDIGTGSVETSEILDETILAEDIGTGSVETSEILNETILAEDIATGSVETSEILNGTIIEEDIANGAINLTSKVSNVLPVTNGGTGRSSVNNGNILIGNGTSALDTLAVTDSIMLFTNVNGFTELFTVKAGLRTFINIDTANKTIEISAVDQSGGPNTGSSQVSVGNISSGSQAERNFPSTGVEPGDIILATTLQDLKGITVTAYVRQSGQVNVIFFNGTNSTVSLGIVDVQFANFGQP